MANEEVNNRKNKQAIENKHRTINYIVIAALAALIVTVLFLAFGGRSDKNSTNGQVQQPATTTEQVNAPSGSGSSSAGTVTSPSSDDDKYNKVTRPTTTTPVNRPTNSTTVNRPGANSNTVSRPANGYGSSSSSSSSNNNGTYTGRTDVPHTTKMDVLNGTYKEDDDNNSSNSSSRRGGTRRR